MMQHPFVGAILARSTAHSIAIGICLLPILVWVFHRMVFFNAFWGHKMTSLLTN